MIVQMFGAIDLIAAALLYSGKIPAPSFLLFACIFILALKGIISIFPIPFYLPGFLMNLADIVAVILLYFGETPMPALKMLAIAVLLLKSIPALLSGMFLVAGFWGWKK